MAQRHDVIIVGGGIIGLSAGYALAREGLSCLVLDRREPGHEASWAGAGMLAPIGDEDRLPTHPTLALRAWSARLHPQWAEALRSETGIDTGYRRCGGVDAAVTEDEEKALQTAAGRWRVEGIAYERLAPGDFDRVEPALNPELRLVYFLPDRAKLRGPRHNRALAAAITQRGGRIEPFSAVEGFTTRDGRVTEVRTAHETYQAGHVVLAAGAWSGGLLKGLGVDAPTPPAKGQIVLVRSTNGRPLLRRIVEHNKKYLVPRDDGLVLIGSTEEDAGFDVLPTAEAYRTLLDSAYRLCPSLKDAEIEAVWSGLRPGSFDARPYIGPAPGFKNLIVATGHKRTGIQLSPATAELVADLVLGRPPRIDLSFFRLDREPATGGEDVFRS